VDANTSLLNLSVVQVEPPISLMRKLKNLIPSRFVMRTLPRAADGCALLTFDDGPDPKVTPGVIDRLDRYGARAVFFVVGHRIHRAPWLLQEVLDRGHTLGNHSFRHVNGRQPGFLEYRRDLHKCQKAIRQQCGFQPWLFRPPCGILSLAAIIAPWTMGLRTVTWSVDLEDWRCRRAEEASLLGEQLGNLVRAGDIVLLHDDNPCVLDLLDAFLPVVVGRQINLRRGIESLQALERHCGG